LHWTNQLKREFTASEDSVTRCSIALGKVKYLLSSADVSSGGRLNEISCKPTARKKVERFHLCSGKYTTVSNGGKSVPGASNRNGLVVPAIGFLRAAHSHSAMDEVHVSPCLEGTAGLSALLMWRRSSVSRLSGESAECKTVRGV
jgi:hypothetical protein